MLRALGTLVLLGLVATAGCSAGSEPAATPDATARPAVAAGSPFAPVDGSSKICGDSSRGGTFLDYGQVTPTRSIVVSQPEFATSAGAEITGAWVTAAPAGAVPVEGLVRGAAPLPSAARFSDWRHRVPMAGATLEPGKTYTLFTRYDLKRGGRLNGIRFSWDDHRTTGVTSLHGLVIGHGKCR